MTSFQLLLGIFGLAGIGAFVVTKLWAQIRLRHQIQKNFAPSTPDILMQQRSNLPTDMAAKGDASDDLAGPLAAIRVQGAMQNFDHLLSEFDASEAPDHLIAPAPIQWTLPLNDTDPLLHEGEVVRMQAKELGLGSVNEASATASYAIESYATQLTQSQTRSEPTKIMARANAQHVTTNDKTPLPSASKAPPVIPPQMPPMQAPTALNATAKAPEPDHHNPVVPPVARHAVNSSVAPTSAPPPIIQQPQPVSRPAVAAPVVMTDAKLNEETALSAIAEHTDCIAHMIFGQPIRGQRLRSYSIRPIAQKTTLVEGCNENGEWQPIVDEGRYSEARYAIVYANKSGALTEIEFSEWVFHLRQIAKGLGGQLNLPSLAQVHQRAKALFQFIQEYSQDLVLTIRPREKLLRQRWHFEWVLSVVNKLGFKERSPENYVMEDADGNPLYQMYINSKDDNVLRLSLFFSIPLVEPEKKPFSHMRAITQDLSRLLDGIVIDDRSQALRDEHFEMIEKSLQQLQLDMQQARLPAGSIFAQRVFN